MPMLPLRVLVIGDNASRTLRVANRLRQGGCREILVVADDRQAFADLEQFGPVDVTLCVLSQGRPDVPGLLQTLGRFGQGGAIIISDGLAAEAGSVAGQLISLLGMALQEDAGKLSQPQALQLLLARHLSDLDNEADALPVVPASEEEVRQALADHQLHTYFQPKFNLQTGDVCSIEALARWHHPFKGVLPPSVFMPVIERCGLLDELLFLQLEQGLRLQRQALDQGVALNVAFNLHAGQLVNPVLTGRIQAMLAAHGLPGSGLTFELTETGLLEAPAISLESLVRLRMMGCSLSIDDFGAGFSSLQRLCQLPFNEIKLDGEFVRGLRHEPRRRAVISSTLALGEALGMSVVVEGIETEEQRSVLLELGCTQGQGYLCARPMSAASLLNWLDLQRGIEASG
ncbi:EAL domain-containing protein [Pseudomonas sp. B35(2017)]|uniref:EAL domain-containing response regulator n=1 Tax=Pseudomonas sp. B35(2017) TaxID=1981722 RepID=UPI000A1E4C41|nr:EAL domain-containing response regulator [Pseudomonas sp. B35(2017)]